jgi:hypothetical protein
MPRFISHVQPVIHRDFDFARQQLGSYLRIVPLSPFREIEYLFS